MTDAEGSTNGTAAAPPAAPSGSGVSFAFKCKYGPTVHSVRLAEDDEVADLKAILISLTDVPAERQKLIGLTKGKLPSDDTLIGKLTFPPASLKRKAGEAQPADGANGSGQVCEVTIILVGTPEALTFKDIARPEELPEGEATSAEREAADIDPSKIDQKLLPHCNPKYIAKVEKIISRFSDFALMAPPRPGKRLLCLDLDYALVDTKRLLHTTSPASEAARPGLHEFLARVYPHFDICVWSQTSWRWLEAKLAELHMLSDPRYKISWVLDKTTMPSVTTRGKKHHVKPLELIWRRFGPEQYSPKNTIHIDDLACNFAMNPRNGVLVKPYKNSPHMDNELLALGRYCLQLAHESITDFTTIDHSNWHFFHGPSVE